MNAKSNQDTASVNLYPKPPLSSYDDMDRMNAILEKTKTAFDDKFN
jgi:hypothetical protein